jgi:hypothetical protein
MTTSFARRSPERGQCRDITDDRVRLGSFELVSLTATGPFSIASYVARGSITDPLREAIINTLPAVVRGPARNNVAEEGGLNIEAIAFVPAAATPPDIERELGGPIPIGDPERGALLLGLRGPLTGTPDTGRTTCELGREPGTGRALYVYLLNPDAYLGGAAPTVRGPFSVSLGDRGFRDAMLIRFPGRPPHLLIVAGRVGGGRPSPALYLFNPRDPNNAPFELTLPPDSDGRAIEAAASALVEGTGRLVLYDDRDVNQASQRVITELPPLTIVDLISFLDFLFRTLRNLGILPG